MSNDKYGASEGRMNPFATNSRTGADLEEEQPEMRHVKIAGPSTPSLKLPSLQGSKLPGPLPKGLLRPPPRLGGQQKSLSVQKEWTAQVKSWTVTPNELDLVPLDFPLERTHREIHGSDACKVATRISGALQKLSINADYEKDEAKCQTADFVSFRIRLFAGGEGCQPVVVEVQRRNGPAMSFMQSCRTILNAAEGVEAAGRKKLPPPFSGKSIGAMKCLQGVSLPSVDPKEELNESVKKAVDMLKNKNIDSNVLGMEDLCNMTDQMKSSRATASYVAKTIMTGGDVDVRGEMYATLDRATQGTQSELEEGGVDHIEQLRRNALRLFDNCLKVVQQEGIEITEQSWVREMLIPMLVAEVRNAKENPHCAYISSCCLTTLSRSPDARACVIKCSGAVHAVREASNIGQECHELLANETQRCLAQLSSS